VPVAHMTTLRRRQEVGEEVQTECLVTREQRTAAVQIIIQIEEQESVEVAVRFRGLIPLPPIVRKIIREKYLMYYNRWVLPNQLDTTNGQEEEEEHHLLCK
jgi:hypothetical protein